MEDMTLQSEWLSTILAKSTRQSYTMSMKYFLEFTGFSKCEDIKGLQKPETRVLQFYQWLQDKKELCSNSSVARVVAIQSFFNYIDRPLRLKRKLPQTHMKLETWRPTLEELQKIYASGDICVKAWMSLSRDCPARISDMLTITPQQIQSGEFLILSQKEKVVGKVFISEETKELFKQLETASISLPKTGRGIDKMIGKACEVSGMPKRLNQHLWRKMFVTKAIDLGISEMIWKTLVFKTVPITDRTYWLEGDRLKPYWEKIIVSRPLIPKTNGTTNTLREAIDIVMKVQRKMIEKELGLEGYQIPNPGLGLIVKKTDREVLEEYLES
jgi:integrase